MANPAVETGARTDVIALAVLHNGVRAREVGGGPVTWRRSLPGIVPGQRLTLDVTKRWRFRRTEMLSGTLLHAGLSLRALRDAGFALPDLRDGRLRSPGEGDDRLVEGLIEHAAGHWPTARCLLLEVLEREPGAMRAHAALGELHARLEHRATALLHFGAAIRLGLGALGAVSPPLDPRDVVARAFIAALIGRARLLAADGRVGDAAADLRRALAWDPEADDAAAALAGLEPDLATSSRLAPPA